MARVLLLVNYRPEYQHGWGSKTYYTQLRLDPLPGRPPKRIPYRLFWAIDGGVNVVSLNISLNLIERTEGNPFFLEESVRTLVETGVLAGEPGATLAKPFQSHAGAGHRAGGPGSPDRPLAARGETSAPDGGRYRYRGALTPPAGHRRAARGGATTGLAHLQAAEFLYETSLFPDSHTPSSTPSPTRWPTAASSGSGGGPSTRASSRPSRGCIPIG